MRALIQRVSQARVSSDGELLGEIGRGYVLLLGIGPEDTGAEVDWLVNRVVSLRLFADAAGKMNLSLQDVGGAVLVVSQFTLYADVGRGRRPSFTGAAAPDAANARYEQTVAGLRSAGAAVETGRFGANMQLEIHNDGPVTIWLEREPTPAGLAGAP